MRYEGCWELSISAGPLVTGLPSHHSLGETYLPVKCAHPRTRTRTHNWLESRQINLRDRSEDAASYREGQTQCCVGEGEGPPATGMKSHCINIHEPSHLSERDSSVSLAVEPVGEGWERKRKEGKKEGR